jgi:diguanylate cyclase (GGDEF)-like protein
VEDDLERGFWRRYARAAHTLDFAIVLINLVYAAATFSTGPNRVVLAALNASALVGITVAIVVVPEQKIANSPRRDLIFGFWCLSGPLLVAFGAYLDGGTTSPLAWLFPLSVMFTSAVHRPQIVVMAAFASLAAYFAVASASDDLAQRPALVLVHCGYLVALGYAGTVTAHFRSVDHDARVALTQRLSLLADRDGLTGLLNHRAFYDHLGRELAQAARSGEPVAVLLIDADHFKSVNDRHGHLVGDDVLKAVAGAIVAQTRAGDLCARIGGEEFCIALPRTDRDRALDVAERIRTAVEAIGEPAAVTVSIGVGMSHRPRDGVTALIEQADAALYAAKHNGRNRVCEPAAA